jgi:biopolymer transport protein ExbD
MTFRRPARTEPDINLTPLIDILFTVLMFLILTTSFQEATELTINVPEANTGQPLPDDATWVRIAIDATGRVFVDDREVALDDLAATLKAVPVTPATLLLLRADTATPHGRVVDVMDAAREAGARQLSIETYREDVPLQAAP